MNNIQALAVYTASVQSKEIGKYLDDYDESMSSTASANELAAKTVEVIKKNGEDALTKFLDLHPDHDLFECSCQNPAATSGMTPGNEGEGMDYLKAPQRYWTRKRIYLSISVVLLLGLAFLLAIKTS